MLFLLMTELFIPRGQVTEDAMRFVVRVLDAAGLQYGREPGRGGNCWVMPDWHEGCTLEEALARFQGTESWGLELWQTRSDGNRVDFHLSMDRDDQYIPFERVGLSTDWKHATSKGLLAAEFLSCSLLLAATLQPVYGTGGSNWGLRGDPLPILGESLAVRQLQEIEWLTIFGAPYVERLGLGRLLSAPVWRRDVLLNGGIALTLAPDHEHVDMAEAERLEAHLGIVVRRGHPPAG